MPVIIGRIAENQWKSDVIRFPFDGNLPMVPDSTLPDRKLEIRFAHIARYLNIKCR